MKRRNFIKLTGISTSLAALMPMGLSAFNSNESAKFLFKDLPYSYGALEPYIDKQTMELHYDKHHRGYHRKFLAALKNENVSATSMVDLFGDVNSYSTAIRNNGGGYYNHALFWDNLSPAGGKPSALILKAINQSFGSLDQLKVEFNAAAKTRFGSGWAWLYLNNDNELKVASTANQDNPLMNDLGFQGIPMLCIDVWEHAYYLKYQNKRGDYISAFWNVVNWNEVNKRYKSALNNSWKGDL